MTTDIERGGLDVSGPHEPSYYEIALTNRQVVVAFVILLICVVAAFLSGVWIGRESATRAQEKLALLSRAAAPGDGAAGDQEKPEGQALQEFKFFADPRHRQEKPKSARSKAAPSPDAPAPEAASPRDNPPFASSAPSASSTPSQSSAPPAAAAAAAPSSASRSSAAAARSTAAVRPPPAETPPGEGETDTTGRPEAPATPRRRPDRSAHAGSGADAGSGARAGAAPASAAAGEVVIQVFSSADKDQADKVRDRLVSAGFTAFLSPLAKSGQTMYRVRVGPFPSRAAAETVAEKVRKEHKLDTWITPK